MVNALPTITPPASLTVAVGTAVTLTTTANDSDGTISTLLGTAVGPNALTPTTSLSNTATSTATLTWTFTPSVAGVYVVTWDCTDNTGAHPAALPTTTVWVDALSGADVKPVGVVLGTWNNVGGAASAVAAITDGSDATWVESPASPTTSQPVLLQLGPHGLGRIDVYLREYYSGGSLTLTANLFKNVTDAQAGANKVAGPVVGAFNSAIAETLFTFLEANLVGIPAVTDRNTLVCVVTAN